MSERRIARRRVLRIDERGRRIRTDSLAAEEPLELRVEGRPLVVTMRTPGNDVELAHGFLLSEGVITGRNDVIAARYCDSVDEDGRNTYNVLDLALAVPVPDVTMERNFLANSACGVCGKASLEAVRTRTAFPAASSGLRVSVGVLSRLPDLLRAAQRVFESTGGLHAAGLFDTDGTLLVAREDVGRHNAVDKVLGAALQEGRLPAERCVLQVSGRASFELVQKAAMAGVPLLSAVSAPSSLAVDLADEAGITLAGFVRGPTMNVYTRPERVTDE